MERGIKCSLLLVLALTIAHEAAAQLRGLLQMATATTTRIING